MSSKKAEPGKDNVIQLAPTAVGTEKCTAEGCKHKSQRAGFCAEHYTWFKEGLLTTEGYHAKDFDKKYAMYMARKEAPLKKVA